MSGDPVRVRAPGRVNLIGEHTDYTGGLAIPIAIDRYTDIVGHPADRLRFRSAEEEGVLDVSVGTDLDAVTPRWGRYIVAVADEMDVVGGFDGAVSTSIPVGAGLSSSAALEVAVALALGFEGTPTELAQLAQRAEHRATGVPTGLMDQLIIAGAVEGHAALIDCHSFDVAHVPVPDDLEFIVRFIAHRTIEGSGYAARVRECATAEAVVGPLRTATVADLADIDDPVIRRRARHVITENQRVRDFAAALRSGDRATIGGLLVEGHRSLRDDFEVSTAAMDAAVDDALAIDGVIGARMTGGGFGGCIVVACEPGAGVDGWRVHPVGGAARISA